MVRVGSAKVRDKLWISKMCPTGLGEVMLMIGAKANPKRERERESGKNIIVSGIHLEILLNID